MRAMNPGILLAAAAVLMITACATATSPGRQLAQETPWWESAAPCRIWVPATPPPGRLPSWDPGPSTSLMSASGDCRALQAALPDNAVLIGAP